MKLYLQLLLIILISGKIAYGQTDLCNNALFFDCGSIDGNNDTDLFSTDNYCGSNSNLTGPEVVYSITPTNTQIYTFTLDVFGTGDLDMFLLEEDCDPSNCIVNSDASSSTADDVMMATLLVGETYYLVIDGDDGSIAEYFLDVFCSPPFQCDAEDIECNEFIASNNDTGISTIDTYCNGGNTNLTGPEKIFRFIPDNSQFHIITLTGFSGDLDLFLLDDACDPDNCITNSDGSSGSTPDIINIFLNAGQEYFIVVDGDGGTISDFTLEVQCGEECEADFTWTEDCGKVQFTSNSIGNGLDYEWTIDGFTFTTANPCYQFLTPGPHTVLLEVFAFGCESSIEQEIEVEICSSEIFCECCDEEDLNTFQSEIPGPVTTFPQAPFNAVYGSPMYVIDGCDNPNSIFINGPSIASPGDGVEYSISGFGGTTTIFEEGLEYCISYCYKAPEEPGNLKLRISDTAQTSGSCSGSCMIIHTAPTITPADGWQTDQFTFVANNNYNSLTFSTDATGVVDGIIPMQFDNVCVSEYTQTCKADFTWQDDGCGNLELTDNSCGDQLNILWTVNGNTFANQSPISFSGAGVYNVTLSVTGADGCSDTNSQTIIVSIPDPPILLCPSDMTVTEVITPNEDCISPYTIPTVTSSTGSTVNCTFNGAPIVPGATIQLQVGNNNFSCFTLGECDTEAQCSWTVILECEIEDTSTCDENPNCQTTNVLNLSTGIDLLGNLIPSGTGQVDPIWRLINNAPVFNCTNPFLSSVNGSAYIMNYVFPNTTAWVNQTGVGNLAPVDLGNGTANLFGCNNIQNANGARVPYVFERIFCVCEEDEMDLQFSYAGDDRLTLELWDLDNNTLLGTSTTYVYTGTAAPSTWNYTGLFPTGSYAIRAKLSNVSSTTLGFSIAATANSLSGNNNIINAGECCEAFTVNARKIIDNDCSGTVTVGDTPGQGWTFNLKNSIGSIIQTGLTDINGEVFFTGLAQGNYTIEEVIIPGFNPISPVGGTENVVITSSSWNTYDFFNCVAPEVVCDSLMVMEREIIDPNNEDLCCYAFDLKNNWGADITNVEVEMLTKDWIFNNVVLDPSLQFGPCTTTNDLFCVSSTTTSIPTGLTMDAINTCIAPAVTNPVNPQVIEIRWMQQVSEDLTIVACRDTIVLGCEPPPLLDCITVTDCEIMCSDDDNPSEYNLCFNIDNNSGFDIGSITLEDLSANFGWQPFCTTSTVVQPIPNPILDGTSSGQICVQLKSTIPIIATQNICYKIGVVSTDGTQCCHEPEEICKEIQPCCDPCEDNGIVATAYGSDEDECCFVVDVDNGCQTGYYTKFEAEINTPGVCFGSHIISPGQAGFWTVSSTNQSICMRPISGTMDQPSYPGLLDFCLDKIDDPTQSNPQVIFKWYAINPITGEEEVVCTDLLESDCGDDDNVCLVVTDQLLECIPDSTKYRYTFTITNVSNPSFTADKLHLTVKNDPFNYVPFPSGNIITLTPPLGPNQSRTISTYIVGTPFPQTTYPNFEFGYRLQNMATGDCCFESQCDTIPIPPCGDESCCQIDEAAFCAYFEDLIDYTEEECKIIMDFNNLDSCDALVVTLPDGSTTTPDIGDELCIPITDGPQQICVQIDRWNNVINELLPCLSKDTCFMVEPSCTPFSCPDCPAGTSNTELLTNGDFEAGNVGFTSDYIVGPLVLGPGEYDIRNANTIPLGNPSWAASDPTNGATGNMLVADGPFTGAIWRQTVNVTSGFNYNFCASLNNLVTLNLNETASPRVELHINGVVVIPAVPISQVPDQWVMMTGSWIATTTGPVTLELFNIEANGFGDLALDDLSFSECTPTMMNECCEDFDTFCDLIDLGWDVTIDDCEVIVKATQFDSCHWMYNVSPDWGDGSIILPTVSPANGCWTHEYDQSGTYNICATIFEGTMAGDTCWTKEICETITVDCPPVNECCEDFDAFCDLIDLGWDVTIDDCEVIVKATQFDSCHWMYNVSPDWGDGSILLPTVSPANGCWTHEYDQSGTYNICATIFEGTMAGDTCWTKEICETITVDCPSCACDGWDDMTVSGAWGIINNVMCNETVTLPACSYAFDIDGSFLCNSQNCTPSYDWSMTKIGGSCISPCFGNFGTGSNFNLSWDFSPTTDPLTSGPGTYELRINGNCSDDAPCSECVIMIVIPDCDDNCDSNGDPCDFTDIDFTPDPVLGDICCYTSSIDNQYCDDYFKGIKITLTGSASISQVQALNGWTITQLDPLNAEIYPPSTHIALGQQDIFRICANNDGSIFNVQIAWLYTDASGNCISICPEDFEVSCNDNPGGCLEIVQDSIDCINDLYCFRVVNTTDPEIIIRSVEFIQVSPTGASLTPNPYSINPLMTGDTSEWVCVNYDALGNPNMCFLLVGHEADLPAGDPISWCCVDDEKHFINIQDDCNDPCDTTSNSCDNISVNLTPDPVTGEECCFVGSITNDFCADYFKGIKITTQAPATIMQVQALNGWYINQINVTEAEIYPMTSHVNLGTEDIFSVCNSANNSPFVISISWLVDDGQGNCTEECLEDFNLTCDDSNPIGGCITVVDEDLNCDDDMYCFKITNNTFPGFTIQSLDLISITPAGVTLSPKPISIPPLLPGQTSDWICVEYDGADNGDEICYTVVGHNEDVTQGNTPTWCCATQEVSCFTVACGDYCPPDCVDIVQDSIACEDRNYCFKVVNNTHPSFEINSVAFTNVFPLSASFLDVAVSIPTLMPGDTSDWICVEYAGVMPEDTLCFNLVGHLEDLGKDEIPTWCCSSFEQTCVVIGDCETCCQDEMAFLDLVDIGFNDTINGCMLSISTTQFDSCHWISHAEPDWGDGSVSSAVVTPANGTWTHDYDQPGTYTVCFDYFEGDSGESICWQATYCMDIVVDCPGIDAEDECDLDLLTVPNGLTPNGDGINDRLIIERLDGCPSVSLTIYNRWGQTVYENEDYNNEWDGKSRSGADLPDGTYFMVVGYQDRTALINSFIDVRR